mgnify:CR=1 FL=1
MPKGTVINNDILKLIEDVEYSCGMINKRIFTDSYKGDDFSIDISGKIECEYENLNVVGPGVRIEIYWEMFDEPDKGYVFTLPMSNSDDIWMAGIVHIPKPQGCEKCDCEPEWIYFNRLLCLPELVKVKILKD